MMGLCHKAGLYGVLVEVVQLLVEEGLRYQFHRVVVLLPELVALLGRSPVEHPQQPFLSGFAGMRCYGFHEKFCRVPGGLNLC